jgi:hypothetical protein
VSRTFSFKALRNPRVSTILTKESFGYKDAEMSDGTRARPSIDKGDSSILIIERRVIAMSVGSYQVAKTTRAPGEKRW